MSFQTSRTSLSRPYSRDGFQRVDRPLDSTTAIPMHQVNSSTQHLTSYDLREGSGGGYGNEKASFINNRGTGDSAGTGMSRGMRRSILPGARPTGHKSYDGEEDSITKMGFVYDKILHFSTTMRYVIYYVPLALILSVPIIIGATAAQNAKIGGVRIVWFFVWLECAWAGLWVSKIVSHWLPTIFQALVGVVSSGTRKYSLVLKALEIQLSLAGWALVALATFMPIMTRNPDTRAENARLQSQNQPTTPPHWQYILQRILAASLVASLIFLGEKMLIQLISINYHRKQFNARIRQSKHNIWLLTLLYDASRALFSPFCPEFAEEDAIIADTLDLALSGGKKRNPHKRSGSNTPMRLLRDAGRLGDKITAAFGNVASEVTGKQLFNPDSAHSIVVEALEKNNSAEALARRLWLSFVIEGNDALFQQDIVEVLGSGRQNEAEECFSSLDRDGNGDISLDEMILTVTEIGRERHSIATSMHDVDQAINVLDGMLGTIVFIIIIFIFIAFLNTSFVTTLATAGTALLSLSFVFSVTCQEVLGSCIFLFVKHPFDIGDRVDVNTDQFVVEHISLLFTVFRRITNHRTVQIPNIVLNTLWIENVSRSRAMREQLSIFVSIDTTLEDINLLRQEMNKFVTDKENCRDFQPEIVVEVLGISELDKMELKVEILHKSNWANETLRASRRSKFMCSLVLALRKIPIYGPGGSGAVLGTANNPSFNVAISDRDARSNIDTYKKGLEDARMVPTRKPTPLIDGENTASELPDTEKKALNVLTERSPALDGARDVGRHVYPSEVKTYGDETHSPVVPGDGEEFDELRGVLKRASTKGKRKSGKTPLDTMRPSDISAPAAMPSISPVSTRGQYLGFGDLESARGPRMPPPAIPVPPVPQQAPRPDGPSNAGPPRGPYNQPPRY